MRLIETIYELILEARPKEIYNKYYSDIEWNVFLNIISLDPKTKLKEIPKDYEIVKIGKYAKLLIKMFKSGKLKPEDYPKAKEYLTLVYKHQVPVDSNKVKELGDLYALVEKYYVKDGDRNYFDVVNNLTDSDHKVLMSGEKWIIYTPTTEKGAAYLGHGTQWCTAWGPYSTNDQYKGRSNHFSQHNNKGSLYVIVKRDEPTQKFQFHFETKQFMNPADRGISTSDFFNKHREVTKYFFPSLFDDTPVDSTELDRMDFLGYVDVATLTEKEIGDTDNKLVEILINNNGDELIEKLNEGSFINDGNVLDVSSDQRDNNRIIFTLSEIGDDVETTKYALDGYKSASGHYSDHGEYLRSDITDTDEDQQKEILTPILEAFYDKNYIPYANSRDEFIKKISFTYFDELINDLADEYSQLNEEGVRSANEVKENEITKYIDIDEDRNSHDIYIPVMRLALFISKENITQITDSESLFDAYVDSKDLNYEYENPMWEIPLEQVSLKDMETHIEGYSSKLEEEFESHPECEKSRNELQEILNKYFTKYGGYNTIYRFNNEHVQVTIQDKFDCEKNGVPVEVIIEEKGEQKRERYTGTISIEKVKEYISMEPLMEE